ncbi:phytanoyl-CoA dioxygenase family protein [Mycobacterium neglectum]|uniref:phytanoyl-CoA dioxygenase family protein n=1 Tax=Mycobacterium neglectum TaxID=242737 RepID=UPI000BFEDEE3|nr:phytanoyl-CoA dioxygenase family protein [Mycobacterium neglectum]
MVTSNGSVIDQDASKFGLLRESSEHAGDGPALRERLNEDGYAFLRDVLDKEVLLAVQQAIADELRRLDLIDPDGDRSTSLFPARPDLSLYRVMDHISQDERRALTRQPALTAIFKAIFGEEAKCLDYNWPRVAGPGRSELPHCDWVYMPRGTSRIYTAWMPLMDLPMSHGPLMILENSHHENPHTASYLEMDADKLGYFDAARFKHGSLVHGGRYSRRPDRVREEFGTRWLSTDYRLGDVIIFSTRALHATLDNRSKGFRLSVDARFQPAGDVTDPRFEGPNPIAHTGADTNIFGHARQLADGVQRFLDKRRGAARTS